MIIGGLESASGPPACGDTEPVMPRPVVFVEPNINDTYIGRGGPPRRNDDMNWKVAMRLDVKRPRAKLLLCAALLVGCNEQPVQPFASDANPPTIAIVKTAGDTLAVANGVSFAVEGSDNLGVRQMTIELTGGLEVTIDTTFTTALTSVTLNIDIALGGNTTAGGDIYIDAAIFDGNDNTATALDSVFLDNANALSVKVLNPVPGGVTAAGKQVPVTVRATQIDGIQKVGYTVEGVFTTSDSMAFALPDTAVFDTVLAVPAGTPTGDFTIRGFAEDASGRRAQSTAVIVTVQTLQDDTIPPVVTFTVAKRVEVSDSITVSATDPSGVTKIGWLATDLSGATVLGGDSTTSNGDLTQLTRKYGLNFTFTQFPQDVIIQAFGVDAAGNRGEAGEVEP